MRRLRLPALALLTLACAAAAAEAQQDVLADLGPYLMDVAAEEAMARSAAPHGLGREADVWVLGEGGYRQVAEGTNGFACFVGRGWSGPILVGPATARRLHPDVFDTELRAPHCFNAAAAETVLPWQFERTRLILDGVSAWEVDARIQERVDEGRLGLPRAGAMAYMTSSGQDLGPDFGSWRPHVMIYVPGLSNADWGIPGFTHDFPFVAESGTPWAVAVVPMRRYSDGSWAPETVTGRGHHG